MKRISNLLTMIFILATGAFANTDNSQHMIVIDAGSSGSRLHLFEYKVDNASTIPAIKELFSKRYNDFVLAKTQSDQVGSLITTLLSDAATVLKDKGISPNEDIKVYVLGTAGMRLFAADHPDVEKAIYENIKQSIKDKSFKGRQFTLGDAKTINETMEALYGWLDVNYLLGNFQQNLPTVGSIDIGGASIEIAFATSYLPEFANDQEQMKIGSQTYNVFRKSYLGLGQDEARASVIVKNAAMAANCFPANYSIDSKGTLGHFNSALCKPLFMDFLQSKSLSSSLPMLANQHFIAFSGADYTFSYLYSSQLEGNVFSQKVLEQHIEKVCNTSNDEQMKSYCPVGMDKFCPVYCANGVYLDSLFYDTLGLSAGQLVVKHDINHEALDWPLGAVVYYLQQPSLRN